jgi:polygalacturonase
VKEYTLSEFGAHGNGTFDNSLVFEKAFQAVHDGGVLHIEKGIYLTGPLLLEGRDIVLDFAEGSVIRFIADETLYRPVFSRWEGVNCYCMHPCFLIKHGDGIVLKGNGILDGAGPWWWKKANEKRSTQMGPVSPIEQELASLNPGYDTQQGGGGGRQSQFLRPPLLQILKSNNVKVEGLTLQNSPFWTLHPLYSTNVILLDVKIHNPKDAPNTDGIDVDSCGFVTIKDCDVDVGDDGIALKSGSGPDGIATALATHDVLIQGCTVRHAHGGAVIGSETAAGIHTIRVRDCFFDGTDRGIRIKTRRGRGGAISNLHFSAIRTRKNLCALTMNMYYRCGSLDPEDFSLEMKPVVSTTPSIEDVLIEDCRMEECTASAAFIVGLPEQPIKGLVIRNSVFSVAKDHLQDVNESEMYAGLPTPSARGIRLRNASYTFEHVMVEGTDMPFCIEDGVVTYS